MLHSACQEISSGEAVWLEAEGVIVTVIAENALAKHDIRMAPPRPYYAVFELPPEANGRADAFSSFRTVSSAASG